jgi:hypothetical protein
VQPQPFATITMYSWWQPGEIGCAYRICNSLKGGGEAGRAHHCTVMCTTSFHPPRKNIISLRYTSSPPTLPQQAQTIESISGHTYIRKRISLTFFVKKLILWSERLFQHFLSDPTLFICGAVTFLNKINLTPHNSYYLINTVKLIRRSSSIIDQYIYPITPRDVKQKAPPYGRFT